LSCKLNKPNSTETNKRLEQQAQSLKASEELLKNQQEELQQTNAELEERSELLALKTRKWSAKNQEVNKQAELLERRAEQLALTSSTNPSFPATCPTTQDTPQQLAIVQLLSDTMGAT